MPRPQKNGIDYFPLDVNFFSDPKIKILKARYGVDGIAVYVYLLCEIYRAGYYIRFDEDRQFIISDDLNMSSDKVMQVLTFLLDRSMLDSMLFQSDAVLTSAGIQRRFQLAVKERAKKNPIEVKDFWLLNEAETEPFIKVNSILNKSQKNDGYSVKNDNKSRELSLKESKVKKSKVNKTNTVTYVPDLDVNQAIQDFVEYRKASRRPMSDRAVELLIKELAKISTDPAEQVEILNQSIMKGWSGVFPLKEPKKDNSSKKPNRFHNFTQRDTSYDEMVQEQVIDWIKGEENHEKDEHGSS